MRNRRQQQQQQYKLVRQREYKYRFLQKDEPVLEEPLDPAAELEKLVEQEKEKVKVTMEGFLRIASDQFEDEKQYPKLPFYQQDKIHNRSIEYVNEKEDEEHFIHSFHDKAKFRKNSKFKDGGAPAIDAFYFRISGSNIYYTETQADNVVLGAIAFKNVNKVEKITNTENDIWDLCVLDEEENCDHWVCAIQAILGQPCPEEGEEPKEEKKEEECVKEIIEQPVYLLTLPARVCSVDFNYKKHGDDWECGCEEKRQQSPIDLPDSECLKRIHQDAEYEWNQLTSEQIEFKYEQMALRIKGKNGGVLGKLTDIDENVYSLDEIVFRTPSEHTIKGERFALEIQLVHNCIKGDMKRTATVSILYEDKPGETMPFFNNIDIMNLATIIHPNNSIAYTAKTFSPHMFTQTDDFLANPVPLSYYKYQGSKTNPPCTPHNVWFVIDKPYGLSTTTLSFIKDSLIVPSFQANSCSEHKLDSIDGNYRNIQEDHEREILFFDRVSQCEGDKNLEKFKLKDQLSGHYERVKKNVTEYVYVNNQEPSGIPGALVVSKSEVDEVLGPNQKQIQIKPKS